MHMRLIEIMDKARKITRENRSNFLARAVAERLRNMGFELDDDWIFPEDRARPVKYRLPAPPENCGYVLNDDGTEYKPVEVNSGKGDLEQAAKEILDSVVERVRSKGKTQSGKPNDVIAWRAARKRRGPMT